MDSQILVKNGEKYKGKYVALNNFMERKIVSFGANLSVVVKNANKKGVKEPVVLFVPHKNITHIYKYTCP